MKIRQKSQFLGILNLLALAVLLTFAHPKLPVSAVSTQAVDSEGVISEEAAVDYRVTQAIDDQASPAVNEIDTIPDYGLTIFLALALLATGYYAIVATKNAHSSDA